MTPFVISLVLSAAILHATWNAMLRSSGDRFLSVCIMDITAAFVVLPFLFIGPLPDPTSWFYILLSALIHVGYSLFLITLYKHGELGQVYPIARGSSPLLVTAGGLFFAGEHLTTITIFGIIFISFGIIALARGKNRPKPHTIIAALATGLFIGSYTVVDGIGARLSSHAFSYAAWMFMIYGLIMTFLLFFHRNRPKISLADRHIQTSALGGIFGLIGYVTIIWAISVNPMGPVSALRETSVVFAALIGRFFLKEKLTTRRLCACGIIALGAACLG